jgi:hypothetical protein
VYVRLIRKFSARLNDFDLSKVSVGDVMALPDKTALMLLNEGWAERLEDRHPEDKRPPVSTR